MLRKLLAAVFALSMVLTAEPIVHAEETVQEISTGNELYLFTRNGGSGKLTADISDVPYNDLSVNNSTSLDMNGHSIKDTPIYIQANARLSLSGSGTIHCPINIDSQAELYAPDTVSFDGVVYLNDEDSRINGGTYNSKVTVQDKRSKSGIIDNGVFRDKVSHIYAVNGGTFNNTITDSTIYGGTFNGTVSSDCMIYNTVTFDSNGGSAVTEQKVLQGKQASDPGAPVRDGYIFTGWYSNDVLYDFSTPVTQNLTLTAKWIHSVSGLTVSDIPAQTYSGTDLTPVITIRDGEYTLVQGQDYTVTYSDNRYVGTAKASVNGIGRYGGNIEKTFVIQPKEVTVSGIRVLDKVYDGTTSALLDTSDAVINGKADDDNVSVYASGSFEDPDAGTNKIVQINQSLEGRDAGNYVLNSGTGTIQGEIRKADPVLSVQAVMTEPYSDNDFQMNVSHAGDGKVTYSSDQPDVLSVSDTGLVHINGAGEGKVIVSLEESKNHISASHSLNISVDQADGSVSIQNAVINKTCGDPYFSIRPSGSVPGKVRYMIEDGDAVSVDGSGNVYINQPGTSVIVVSMEAAGGHRAISETITIKVAAASSSTLLRGVNQKDYVITTGNKTEWKRGSGKQLIMISDGDYDLFNGLYVDGSVVDRSDYELKKGSTEIYLKPSYLETLTAGKHTFELRYRNGRKASGEFTIVEAENPAEKKKNNETAAPSDHSEPSSSPDTSDHTDNAIRGFTMIAAVICAVGVVVIKKKRLN